LGFTAIKGLSFGAAVRNALFKSRRGEIKTLDEFVYPRLGDGQVHGTLAANIIKRGSTGATGAAWLDQLENLLPRTFGNVQIQQSGPRYRDWVACGSHCARESEVRPLVRHY
jgi:hypothetical protein